MDIAGVGSRCTLLLLVHTASAMHCVNQEEPSNPMVHTHLGRAFAALEKGDKGVSEVTRTALHTHKGGTCAS